LSQPQRLPLSFAQETMLFWDKLALHSAVYNVPLALKIEGRLDRSALKASTDLIVSRHEVLRSLFSFDHGEPAVVVRRQRESDFSFVDLSALPPSEKALTIHGRSRAEACLPFRLDKDLMLRATLFRLSETE